MIQAKLNYHLFLKKMGINEDVLTGLITNDDTRCEEISSTETPFVLLLVLLFPDISHVNLKLDNLISNVFIFILSDEIITLFNYSFSNILENVQKETAHQNNESSMYIALKLILLAYKKMLSDLRTIKDRIDHLESQMNSLGPNKTVFLELFNLQKLMIVIESTYKEDESVLKLIKHQGSFFQLNLTINKSLFSNISNQRSLINSTLISYKKFLNHIGGLITNVVSFQLNIIMKTLSELSIVLSIPTIIFGFWGMNTKVPLSNESHGTVVIITVSLICSILVYNWLKKKKYL